MMMMMVIGDNDDDDDDDDNDNDEADEIEFCQIAEYKLHTSVTKRKQYSFAWIAKEREREKNMTDSLTIFDEWVFQLSGLMKSTFFFVLIVSVHKISTPFFLDAA